MNYWSSDGIQARIDYENENSTTYPAPDPEPDSVNVAHISYYANLVLEALNIETQFIAFWRVMLEGTDQDVRDALESEFGNIFNG